MIRSVMCVLLIVGMALSASLAGASGNAQGGFDLAQLMAELATYKGGKALFVEKRYLGVLDKPITASGEMRYLPPDYLEKRTLMPKVETMVLDGDQLSLERDQRKFSISLSRQPEALAFVDSIRGTLSGNRAALERNFALSLNGNREHWTLTLLPGEQKIAALVQRITVSGRRNQVDRIEYLQTDGDRSVLDIQAVELK
jgi:outer membrane lipoprotein-sorting protein